MLTGNTKPDNPVSLLLNLAEDFDMISVEVDKLREISDEDIEEASAIVRTTRSGRRELLLTDAQLKSVVTNTRAFFAHPGVNRMLISEQGRKQNKRQIRKKHRAERFFCFLLPEKK